MDRQNYRAGTFILQNSSRRGIVALLDFVDTHGLGRDYLEKRVAGIMALEPEGIRAAAETYLDPQHMVIVLAGDTKKIREQLAPYGAIVE